MRGPWCCSSRVGQAVTGVPGENKKDLKMERCLPQIHHVCGEGDCRARMLHTTVAVGHMFLTGGTCQLCGTFNHSPMLMRHASHFVPQWSFILVPHQEFEVDICSFLHQNCLPYSRGSALRGTPSALRAACTAAQVSALSQKLPSTTAMLAGSLMHSAGAGAPSNWFSASMSTCMSHE